MEVINAIELYEQLKQFKFTSDAHFLKAHGLLMKGLVDNPGKYRTKGVGIVEGNDVEHIAPPSDKVPYLMKDLFTYLKDEDELTLIKSCVFHYKMEFIHPFLDGNGRMGRFWQTLILSNEFQVFEFLPFETLINDTQNDYYQVLSMSDKMGKSTIFIEYMLGVINSSLARILNYNNRILKDLDRIAYFISLGKQEFARKDYMNTFKELSSATASRDLKKGVELGFFEVSGSQNKTKYKIV